MSAVLGVMTWALELLYALAVIGAFVAMIINITKLSQSAGNPRGRADALHGILVSGGCIAALGGIGLLFLGLVSFMG